MHSHNYRYLSARAVRSAIIIHLKRGEVIPCLLEMRAAEIGINIDALREANS